LELDKYQQEAFKYRVPLASPEERVFGLLEEAGEVAGIFKRFLRGDFADDIGIVGTKLHKELGDVLWYLSQIAEDNGWKLSEVAEENLKKLESRRIRNMITGTGDNR
jgi:NTP pyrophosphatase (non-canonical NTP hydrolase)